MPLGSPSRLAASLMLFGLTGCAAPIKAWLSEPAAPIIDRAALQAADEQEAQLRAALMEKGKALVNARALGTPPVQGASANPPIPAPVPVATAPKRGASPAVTAMLARAKVAEPPRMAKPDGTDLTRAIRVKDETRLGNSPTGSPERRPDAVVIRFAPGAPTLDAEGNRALAELARRSELSPAARIVLVAGLSGAGTPWERMQSASERLEVVARHVPPPLKVEKRFELELENRHVRLELHREAR